jgi:hypothetical protein
MIRSSVTKRVYCKQAVFLDSKDKPQLQNKVSEALSKLKKVGARKETIGDDNHYVRAVIYHRSYANMLFGILASYDRGTHQLTVADDDEAEMLTVDQVAPPKNENDKRQEFLEGVCYFGISNNHIVLVPSRALGVKPMEHHINWILEQAGLIGNNNHVCLSDQITQVTKERIRASHVKEIEIGAPFINAQEHEIQHDAKEHRVAAFEYTGLGMDVLRKVLGTDKVNNMRLADAIDGNIEVTLKIRYKRTTTDKAHKLLDNIALAVRNLDEDEVKLTLASGGTVKGNELKLFAPISIQAQDGIPNPDELFEKMRNWLIQQIENKIIEP